MTALIALLIKNQRKVGRNKIRNFISLLQTSFPIDASCETCEVTIQANDVFKIEFTGKVDDDNQISYGKLAQRSLKTDLEVAAVEGPFRNGFFDGKIR